MEKEFSEAHDDRNENNFPNSAGGNSGVRARGQNINIRRKYGNAIGPLGVGDDDSTETGGTRDGVSRRRIRERLKEKEKVPGHVQWIKWMHSDWKNRRSTSLEAVSKLTRR
jgi:aquaporin related protein